jgi:four helix bundle protein
MELAKDIYRITRLFPKEEMYGLTQQIRRSAVSVASNIAEGSGRNTAGEFHHFLGMAAGSLAELKTQLLIAADVFSERGERVINLIPRIDDVSRMLSGLKRNLSEQRAASNA